MQDENICTTCGHDKWSHAISLKGEVGACMRETIKDWSWCSCEKFTPPNKACSGRVDSSRSPELFPAEVESSAKVQRQSARR